MTLTVQPLQLSYVLMFLFLVACGGTKEVPDEETCCNSTKEAGSGGELSTNGAGGSQLEKGSGGSTTIAAVTGGSGGSEPQPGSGGAEAMSHGGAGADTCCSELPSCQQRESEIYGQALCDETKGCHEVSLCCNTIHCAPTSSTCSGQPTCKVGQDPVIGDCPEGSQCKEYSLCGRTILCKPITICTKEPECVQFEVEAGTECPEDTVCNLRTVCGVSLACLPEFECNFTNWNRLFWGEDRMDCGMVDPECEEGSVLFLDDCGCGCEQPNDCPYTIDCAAGGPNAGTEICSERTYCPFSERVQL